MVLGITGHQRLQDEGAWSWVEGEIRSIITQTPLPIIGLSSLAVGADQLFAKMILRYGCELRVILPFPTYEETFTCQRDRECYRSLLDRASFVEELPALFNKEESYMAAGQRVVVLSDRMIAVWDEQEAAGLGGTGDVVHYALAINRDVLHLNPECRKVKRLLPRGFR